MSHVFDLSHATMLPPAEPGGGNSLDLEGVLKQWEAVHQAAAAVGHLAQLGREEPADETTLLPVRAADLEDPYFRSVANAVDDLSAVMQPGLRALLALSEQGKDTTSAALALWREFHVARNAILSLVRAGETSRS